MANFTSVGDSLQFQLIGFLIVLIVLASLWLLISLVGAAFRSSSARRTAAAPPPAAAPAIPASEAASASASVLPPEILAVIAAAVHATVGSRGRVASIVETPHHPDVNLHAWSIEGRRMIFSSHQIR